MAFYRVEIKNNGTNPLSFIQDIQYQFFPEMQEKLLDLSYDTLNMMREIIVSNKKRPSLGGNLEETLDVEILNSTAALEIGIGNIADLKAKAPYFEVLNDGGYVPYSSAMAAPLGSFYGDRPETGGSGQNWERSGSKGFLMKPKKVIEGISYIDLSEKNLIANLEIITKTWINSELNKMGK
jgi:hypothetical protein